MSITVQDPKDVFFESRLYLDLRIIFPLLCCICVSKWDPIKFYLKSSCCTSRKFELYHISKLNTILFPNNFTRTIRCKINIEWMLSRGLQHLKFTTQVEGRDHLIRLDTSTSKWELGYQTQYWNHLFRELAQAFTICG